MSPREIARWMREEHAAVKDLAQSLRERATSVPHTGLKEWVAGISGQIGSFQAHLHKHFELEETGGYLEGVTDRFPALSGEVKRLQSEHDEIGHVLGSIHLELGAVTEQSRILIEDCRSRVHNLLRCLEDHEEREDLMVLSAFTNDLGTKD